MRQRYLHILFKYSQNFALAAQVLAGLYPTEHAHVLISVSCPL